MTPAPTATASTRERLPSALAAALGISAFLPVGMGYLLLLLLSLVLLAAPQDLRQRLGSLRGRAILGLLAAFVAWPCLLLLFNPAYEATASRLFHLVRVAWVLVLGLLLTPREQRAALCGFLGAAAVATLLVAIHHVWPLPEWTLWRNLVYLRGNNSSQKMLLMACAAGVAFSLALGPGRTRHQRLVLLLGWLAFSAVVVLHGMSRNAHVLVLVLPALALVYRFRTWAMATSAIVLALALSAAALQWSATVQLRVEQAMDDLQALETNGNYASSVGVRWRMYEEAWRGMVDHPITGTGLGSWETRWRAAATEYPDMAGINNPHNDFLLFGTETGVPGLLLLLATLGWFAVTAWRARHAAAGAAWVLCGGLIMSAMVNAPLRDAGLGMALLWLMAACSAPHRPKEPHA